MIDLVYGKEHMFHFGIYGISPLNVKGGII